MDERLQLMAAARAGFLEGSDVPPRSGVPDHVVASWRRSLSSGVRPSVVASPYFAELDLDSRLVRCAGPVMDQLAEQLADIPMCVALTDGKARLLARTDSNRSFGRVTDRLCFAQGFGYAEGVVGTNGVGTVLAYGRSVYIVGPEHFVDPLQLFACAGAPIRDPFAGRIEGVLDISCFAEHSSPILHSLIRAAAMRVEQNLLDDRNLGQQALFDRYARIDTRGRDAVLAVGQTLVMANTRLQSALDAPDRDSLHSHVRFLMHRRTTVDDRIDLPSGRRVRWRASTVAVGDEVVGMVGVVTVLDGDADAVGVGDARPASGAPRHADVGSSSPALRAAAAATGAALDRGSPVLVLGERSSGRFALLREQFRGECVGISADEFAWAPREAADRVLRRPPDVLHVVRDVDRAPEDAVAAFLERLRGAAAVPLFAATSAELTGAEDAHQPLLGLFGASATVPPLRHRAPDLPALAAALLAELAPRRDIRLTHEALRVLTAYRWPGNVGQLRDALADAVRVRPVGAIEVANLPTWCQSAPRSALRPVDEVERDVIVAALRDAGGNRKAAAAALGFARSTLYRKIRQYGITD